MTTTWTHIAILSLKGHYEIQKKAKGVPSARAWRKKVFDRVESLILFPRLGRQETSRLYPSKEFRSILEGKYRIVYEVAGQVITVHLVFDTRQNPESINF